jgi:CheY-specific phosphatase CheX
MSLSGEDKLIKLIRNISLARLVHQGQIENLEIGEIERKLQVYSHWMSIILISGPGAKITFKTHFKTQAAKVLASRVYKVPPESMGLPQAIDFMREFCNLTAGGIKASLLQHNLKLALSLPIITRGFDEIFFGNIVAENSLSDCWTLKNADFDVVCTSTIEFFETADLSQIDTDFEAQQESKSEIEMF